MSRRHRFGRRPLLALVTAGALAAGLLAAAPAASADSGHFYLALGDSLSQGYQGAHDGLPAGNTDSGYVDDVYAGLHAKDPSLQLVKLGCSGETTATMISGGICTYSGSGSQLAAAKAFLTAHRGQVSYLTLDIGANDVDHCASTTSIDVRCVLSGIATIAKNLRTILSTLRAADGDAPVSVGMNYYDPFLAYWATGLRGRAEAIVSVGLVTLLNVTEQALYGRYGFATANVFAAFKTADFRGGNLFTGGTPANLATLCTLTYMCSELNIHPTAAGYQLIATAFATKLS